MTDLPIPPQRRIIRWWLVPFILVAVCIVALVICQVVWRIQSGGRPIAALVGGDCVWSANVQAWVDLDHNGTRGSSDPPLPGVIFHADDILGGYRDVADSHGPTNWKGETHLAVWLPGCPAARFEIYPDTPSGYAPVSDLRPTADAIHLDKTFDFGFVQLAAMPTLTPRPPSPTCESYRLGNADRHYITDIDVAPDGSVWVSTWGDGLRWLPPGKSKWISIRSRDGLINDRVFSITALSTGVVWFAAREGASSFDGQKWNSFLSTDSLSADIAIAPNGEVWFVTSAGVSRVDPATSTWTPLQFPDPVTDVAFALNGIPWIISSRGVARVEVSAPDSLHYVEGLSFKGASQWGFAPNGILWITGLNGVARYDPVSEHLTIYDRQSTGGVIDDYVHALAFGSDGSLWIGSSSESPTVYQFLPWLETDPWSAWRIYDARDILPSLPSSVTKDNSVRSIAISPSGEIWIATPEHATRCRFEDQ
jgi:hypothetical protein